MQNKEIIPFIESKLRAGGISPDDVPSEARIIAEDIGELPLKTLLADPENEIAPSKITAINKVINMRVLGRYPLQYLVPTWEWYGIKLKIVDGVLCPRQETEMLIDIVRSYCKEYGKKAPIITDLCTGSGNIAITLKSLFPDSFVYAVENSPLAIPTFKYNCTLNKADIMLIPGNVLERSTVERFRFEGGAMRRSDVIVCNPPYLTRIEMNTLQPELKHEPQVALYGGLDGLDFYRTIPSIWKDVLVPGGLLLFEIGADQAKDVRRLLVKAGYSNVTVRKDLMGNDRAVMAINA